MDTADSSSVTRPRANSRRAALARKAMGERYSGVEARSPDARADIFEHLPWIGPGTFLVAAYVHKHRCDEGGR
jgi:hypothetical protein